MNGHSLTTAAIVAGIFITAHSPLAAADMQRGDPVLVDLVATEYTSIEEFLDALIGLKAALVERGDSRVVFVAVYIVLSEQAQSFLEADLFDDAQWAEALTPNFTNRFRQAFFDYETGNLAALSGAWRVAFDAELLRVVLTQWRYRAWRTARLFDGSLPTFYESLFSWFLDLQTGQLARVIAIGSR